MRHPTVSLSAGLLAFTLAGAGIGQAAAAAPLLSDLHWQDAAATAQPAAERDTTGLPHVTIPALPAAPKVDADLADPAWRAAATTGPWMVSTGVAQAQVQTQAWLGTFGGRLYVGLRCDEPSPGTIVAEVAEDGGPAWEDDCVELFFDGDLDQRTFGQIVVNSLGAVTAPNHGMSQWQPSVERAVRVGDAQWEVELSVPIRDLQVVGRTLGLNLCRERRAAPELELSCWSPTGGGFGFPGRFGLATMHIPHLDSVRLGRGLLGRNELTAVVVNDAGRRANLRLRLRWGAEGSDSRLESTSVLLGLEPGERREARLPYQIAQGEAPVCLEFALLDAGGQLLAQRSFLQRAPAPLATLLRPRLFFLDENTAGLRVRLVVSDDLRERAQLVVAVFSQPDMRVLARQEIGKLRGDLLTARVSLPHLAEGSYSFHVILKQPGPEGPRRVAESRHGLRRLTGPFADD